MHLLLFAGSSRKPSWRPLIWTARRSLHVNGVLKGLDGHHDGKELGHPPHPFTDLGQAAG